MYFFRAFFATILLRNAVADGYTMCGTVKPTQLEENQANEVVANFMDSGGMLRAQGVTVKIDTYWHTMKEPGGTLGNTDGDVENSMKVLNDAFAPEFEFVLKKTTVTTDKYWPLGDDSAMKNELHEGDRSALNIWSTKLRGGLLGYATFPNGRDSNSDGVVILYSSVPGGTSSPYNGGDTLTHEVGHWLMLYHTFQGGCSGSGDGVDDTPAVASPGSGCPTGRDSCVDNQGKDLIENYMDYTTDACMDSFTAGQRTRMMAAWEKYRRTGPPQTDEPTSIDTEEPTSIDTEEPTSIDTEEPTSIDTEEPTSIDTEEPTSIDTEEPTSIDTEEPTSIDTEEPTSIDTEEPTSIDTEEPTSIDTEEPTSIDTEEPTSIDTEEPTSIDTEEPTSADSTSEPTIITPEPTPTVTTAEPTETPTATPTAEPTAEPTAPPTAEPTAQPTAEPTAQPTAEPTAEPTSPPTAPPTDLPTTSPTGEPTDVPTATPTATPTETPVCKYGKEKKCVIGGCIWTPARGKKEAKCAPCSDQKKLKSCVKNGCLWQPAAGKKSAGCSACSDQKEKNCVKKGCILAKKSDSEEKLCISCASMSGKSGKCLKAKCAYDKPKKTCTPCSDITKEKICEKMKSCSWKAGKNGKKGKCGKVKGKVALSCCDYGPLGSPDFLECCETRPTCPTKCLGWEAPM